MRKATGNSLASSRVVRKVSSAVFRTLLAASVLALTASASEVDAGVLTPPEQLRARVTPEAVKLGQPLVLELLVSHALDQRYELKTPGDLGDFDYLGQERKRVDGQDSSTTTFQVRLAAFALGSLETPELQLEVTAPGGTATLPVPRAKVTVVSTLPPDAASTGEDLLDVKPPLELPVRSWRVVYVLLALLWLALFAYLVRRYLQRKKQVASAPEKPKEPLHLRATAALDALAKEDLPGRGEFKRYYFRLSEVVRGYLGELYGFEALESTTPELLAALRTRRTPGLPVAELVAFAEASDFIRYAKLEPTLPECALHLELAYRIIHATHAATSSPPPP